MSKATCDHCEEQYNPDESWMYCHKCWAMIVKDLWERGVLDEPQR